MNIVGDAVDKLTQMGVVTLSIISIIVYVLLAIANWKIFTKAGEKGWKSLIPFYNGYILYKITWKTLYFWIDLVLCIIVSIILAINPSSNVWGIIVSILSLASAVINIIDFYKLSKAFNHGIGYTIGLVFLPNIFTLIIGLGKSTYIGNK